MDVIEFERLVKVYLDVTNKAMLNEEEITKAANQVRLIANVEEAVYLQAIKNIQSEFNITIDVGKVIEDHSQISWYPMRKAEVDHYYWNRYRIFLKDYQSWPEKVIDSIDTTTDEIMDLLGDPSKTNSFKRKGLLVGDVQSGKTATYTAICNKAADVGYKVIILLTGTIESLRRQTQERIDSGFVGRKSKEALNRNSQSMYVGVGGIDSKRFAMTFTSEIRDFSDTFLNNLGLRLKDNVEPVIFVVKKNKRTLENLYNWLRSYNVDVNGKHINLPLLMIDDEADNASVNTRDDDNPTAINSAIRDLISLFTRSTYLGVTATPFANIFINPDAEEEMLGNDLFPSNFIYSLPTNSDYIGSLAIFGENAKYDANISEINDIDEDIDEFLRFHQKRVFDLELYTLPTSLQEAIYYYVLTNAIRDKKGQKKQHRSMLINISRLKAVHRDLSERVRSFVNSIKADVMNYSMLEVEKAIKTKHINGLKEVWDKFNLDAIAEMDWKEVQQTLLARATQPIEIREINSSKQAQKLDYTEYSEVGARIIAVGGNALSRGLTLEGLCVSYFYRNSKMYDTLLQMGRWFGYRPNYEDLFRVYMTRDAIDWFQYITEATYELKNEISRMNSLGLTPNEFGLRVRQDINSLIVTARNKMKHTDRITRNIQIAGNLIETPRLPSNEKTLLENEKVALSFFEQLKSIGEEQNHYRNEKLFKEIDSEIIISFLSKYVVHPANLAFNIDALIRYIRSSQSLEKWDVAIPQGLGESCEEFGISYQKRTFEQKGDMLLVNGTKVRVGSGGCTKAGLDKGTVSNIISEYELYLQRTPEEKRKTPPDKVFLTENRNPLLLLHVLEMKEESKVKIDKKVPLIALGIGLPLVNRGSGGTNGTIQYVINLVALRNGIIEPEDEGDDFYDVD
ncbi:MAG: endonuclease [Firmicutes bacterium HGW-Firmicutes-2]|jgi:hypothetical protein|nr:MAG: endonuclease [Firmicutes bacterium HGW-Firmicutes-2]